MSRNRTLAFWTGVLLSLVALGAVAGGVMLMLKPDGTSLKLSVDLLQDSPFKDYFIPGIILLVVNGILGFIGAYLGFKNNRYAGISSMILGLLLIIWISAQVYWFGWASWLQPAFITIGVVEMILGFFIEVQNHQNWRWFGGRHDSHAH